MNLSNDALISVEDFYAIKGVGVDSQSDDDKSQIIAMINAVSLMIVKYCGRAFRAPAAAISEVFSGDGTKDYYSKNKPIATSPSPTLSYWDGSAWQQSTATYTTDYEAGRIYFTDGSLMGKGEDNWKLVYSYGYSIENIPSDVKMAAFFMVQRAIMRQEKQGITSLNFGNMSTSYDLRSIADDTAMQILSSYRRYVVA